MSNHSASQIGEEHDLYDAMEGHQIEEQYEDEMGEEIVAIRHTGAVLAQAGDADLAPPAHGGPPLPPPPGRPAHRQATRAPIRTTRTILGRNPAIPSVGTRMGMNPTFSPRPAYPHIPTKDDSRPYKSAPQPQHFDNLKSADEWPVWERRVRNHFRSVPGYGEQL